MSIGFIYSNWKDGFEFERRAEGQMGRYLIGIDLGTTNIALSYVDKQKLRRGQPPEIETFRIPQLVSPGETKPRELLPSYLYLPGEHDLPAGATALPWDASIDYVVGEFARNHGGKIPGRLVTSAKSWLCHGGVDRTEPLLPWTAPPEVERLSPVEASARYLRHLVEAWNYAMAADDPDARLEEQEIVLTVPASFDDTARTLTMQAAEQAGLRSVVLLEEPQAAFYCWLATHSVAEAATLQPGWDCLVVDVGGGTTDFSLIRAVEEGGELGFTRQAVGDHLLLGGDNMDLALAKFIESKLPQAGKLDAVQYGVLTQACRQAKEELLAPDPPASQQITIVGRGRRVIGGTFHAELTPHEVRRVLLETFFPETSIDTGLVEDQESGLHEMGLPYVRDRAVTRHLARFLGQHSDASASIPRAVLFNGGVFQPLLLRQRVIEVMRSWYGDAWQPFIMHNPSLDLAVSIGAAYFAWVRHTGGKRIGGGIPRSYYLGVGTREGDSQTMLCVVPQHMREGEEVVLDEPELELAVGRPVTFPFFTSTVRGEDRAGDVLQVSPGQLWRLPPLRTVLRGGKRSGVRTVPVTLRSRITPIGTIELWCCSRDGNNEWRLEFNIREIVKPDAEPAGPVPHASDTMLDVWPEEQVEKAVGWIRRCFREADPETPPSKIIRRLEQALGTSRKNWPMTLCRRLWEALAEVHDARHRSRDLRNRWYNLVGWCLRPGFGDSLDSFRVEQLWKLLHAPAKGGKGAAQPEAGEQFWIMMRRVSGGLDAARQRALFNRLRPFLLPGKGKKVAKPPVAEYAEMWRTAAALELIGAKAKEQLGDVLVRHLKRKPLPNYVLPCLARVGGRVLLYGPLNAIVHPDIAARWLEAVMSFRPSNDNDAAAWAFCLVQLARPTGQRALDIDEGLRRKVVGLLRSTDVSDRWIDEVEQVRELAADEKCRLLGDELPAGLRLAAPVADSNSL